MTYRYIRIMTFSGLVTGLCIGSGLGFPFWYELLMRLAPQFPFQIQYDPQFWPVGIILAGVVVGLALARVIGLRPLWRFGLAGGVSIGAGFFLVTSAPVLDFTNNIRSNAPLHIRFAFELVLGLGVAASLLGLALGLALPDWRTALKLCLGSSFASMVSAIVVVVSLDLIGVRVGSGNMAMPKVVGMAFPLASITSGAVIGRLLAQFKLAR